MKNPQLPKTIKIGYQDVSIIESSGAEDTTLADNSGYYCGNKSCIVIKRDSTTREKINTLLHEALHASFYNYGMRDIITDREREEYICNTLGNAMTQLLVGNPEFLDWVKHNVKN